MKLDKKIEKVIPYEKDRIVMTELDDALAWDANIYRIDSEDNIIWQIEPTPDMSFVGVLGDFYSNCWFSENMLIALNYGGYEFQIDLETGKRIKYLRFSK
jgi:hypothetical protein